MLTYDPQFSIVTERKYRNVKIICSAFSRFQTPEHSHRKQKGITYGGGGVGGGAKRN
jgi:hypothetical protein